MATMDIFNSLFFLCGSEGSKKEKILLEAVVFSCLYQELTKYFECINDNQKGDLMINTSIIRNLVNDLLDSNEYSLQGLANYTGYPEDVICDLAAGINANPTLKLSAKIIELHAIAHRDFYSRLFKKIVTKFITH